MKVQLSSLNTGLQIYLTRFGSKEETSKKTKRGGNIFESCLKLCCVSPSSSLINKNLFSDLGYFDEELPACEDYDFWLRYSVQNEFHYVEKPLLIKNGGHSDQLSKKYWGMDRFRVLSMEKLLKNDLLTEYQRNAIHNELIFKLDILINGARKRDNTSFFAEMSKKKVFIPMPSEGLNFLSKEKKVTHVSIQHAGS